MMLRHYLQIRRHDLSLQREEEWLDIQNLDFQPFILEALAQLGAIDIRNNKISEEHLTRARKVIRLRSFLGVNLAGACVILDLLDRIGNLQEELEAYKKQY